MQLGVVFPQNEIGEDPGAVRAFAETAEELGYEHLIFYDHVLGADTGRRPDWRGPYSHRDTFHEPLVTFGYLAALTSRIELVTGVIILPQRQTVLVAKQAAQVDVLSGGRLRLGVGIGWNDVEYEGLNENFHNRGKRSEEQVELLRALWTNEVVDFQGRWHSIPGAGIKPLPVQRPIPVWFGGGRSDGVLRRIARLGDGWFPQLQADEEGRERMERFKGLVEEAGRSQDDVGVDARVALSRGGIDGALRDSEAWQEMGATHVTFNTLRAGLGSPDEHIDALRRFKEAAG
ncbi:MAG: LLM class F420-dependent oxidoreductase [Chloroflexota bacterium]|nr:LLM class F420-dependent oxidoreductase [Chloroflexota bacterium]MDE2884092.1 LLM class F420-dependent oxidoreductase [Chloroflexota bacterium]